MKQSATISDTAAFLRAWIADPFQVAAVVPSGEALAALITRELGPQCAPVVELGPGTGSFTRAMLDRGLKEEDLFLVEAHADFARMLAIRFPQAKVLCLDATRMPAGLGLDKGVSVGAVVSGLPILAMSAADQLRILARCFGVMRPDASFYQFTYGPTCPVSRAVLDRLGLTAARMGSTFKNLPPASVYRISRL